MNTSHRSEQRAVGQQARRNNRRQEQTSLNTKQKKNESKPVTIETADFGGKVYKDKYDTSHAVSYGEVLAMVDWIKEQFTNYWKNSKATAA